MARKDEVKVSDNIVKYMKYLGSYDDNNYTVYQFEDESGNIALHYQLQLDSIEDKKAKGMARLFNTKMAKIKIGDIAVVICKCREMHEEQYDNSVFYLNVEKILKPLVKYETINQLYNGIPTEFVKEVPITSWEELGKFHA